MNQEIENYIATQSVEDQKICIAIVEEINKYLSESKSKMTWGNIKRKGNLQRLK